MLSIIFTTFFLQLRLTFFVNKDLYLESPLPFTTPLAGLISAILDHEKILALCLYSDNTIVKNMSIWNLKAERYQDAS